MNFMSYNNDPCLKCNMFMKIDFTIDAYSVREIKLKPSTGICGPWERNSQGCSGHSTASIVGELAD